MTITVSFVATVAVILVAGTLHRRWDNARHLRFTDEAGSARATLPLARVEARRLAVHPAFLITLGLVAAISGLLVATEHDATVSVSSFQFFTFIGVPVGALALVVAAHRNATRSRRDGTDELFASTPTSPRSRTAAFLLACLGPLPVAVAYLLAARLALEFILDAPIPSLWGAFGTLAVAILLAVVGGGVVGVFLSRWLPMAAAALVGIVAIIWLNNGPDNHDPNFRWLRVAVEEDLGGRFDIDPGALRLVFIAGLVGLGACLALWRHPARPTLVGATVVSVALVAGTGWVISRPPSAEEVARVVDELEHPTDHQTCTDRNGVDYCAYPGAEPWVDLWERAVAGTLDRVPAPHRPAGFDVVQRESVPYLAAPRTYNGGTSYPYLDEVVAALDPEVAWADDGDVHPSLQLNDDMPDLDVAFQVAALAVGLPPSAGWEAPQACRAGGQARVVLASWLAGGATATTAIALRAHAAQVEDESLEAGHVPLDTVMDYENESAAGGERYPVVGAAGYGSDVVAAAAMLDADQDRVIAAVSRHWDELVLASTPTSRLLGLAGVAAPDGPAMVPTSSPGACP